MGRKGDVAPDSQRKCCLLLFLRFRLLLHFAAHYLAHEVYIVSYLTVLGAYALVLIHV